MNGGTDTSVQCDDPELKMIEASCAIVRKLFFNLFAWYVRDAVSRAFDNRIERAR